MVQRDIERLNDLVFASSHRRLGALASRGQRGKP
jgi:hypothetical protein